MHYLAASIKIVENRFFMIYEIATVFDICIILGHLQTISRWVVLTHSDKIMTGKDCPLHNSMYTIDDHGERG